MSRTSKIRLIGRREMVAIPALNIAEMECKIDTGAYTSSLHVEKISIAYEENKPVLYFNLVPDGAMYRFPEFAQKVIKNSFGEMEERYVIKTVLKIGKKRIRTIISLSNRDNMRYPLLVGRRVLKNKFLIDVNRIHTGGISLGRVIRELKSKEQ